MEPTSSTTNSTNLKTHKPPVSSAQKSVPSSNKLAIKKRFSLRKYTVSRKLFQSLKKHDISLQKLIPFSSVGAHITNDIVNFAHKSADNYRKFEIEDNNYLKIVRNELAVSNFLMFNIFKAKDKTDAAYWNSVGFVTNITRSAIRYPVSFADLALNNYIDLKWNLIKNRKFGALFILFFWLANRPFIKPFINGLKKIKNFLALIFLFKFFHYFIHVWAKNNRLKQKVNGKDMRTSFYKFLNFSIYNLHKFPLLREKATTPKERLLNILKRPHSRVLAIFTPFKTFVMTILIMTLFTILYLTIIH